MRVCLLLDLDLSWDRGRDGGSELGELIVGIATSGNKLAPGLAEREMRGQGIEASFEILQQI